MATQSDFMRLDVEAFGRDTVRHSNALDPVLSSQKGLEAFSSNQLLLSALNSLLAGLKAQRLKLEWFEKQI
ncbi:MAG: hypothetical protein J6Y62_00815 [Clostridia bacterium]|nr:hypothetical protein [Clostridia bacterium]